MGLTEKFDESLILLKRYLGEPKFDITINLKVFHKGAAPLDYGNDQFIINLIKEANQADLNVYQFL